MRVMARVRVGWGRRGEWWRWRGVRRDWETIFNLINQKKESNLSPAVYVSLHVLLWGGARGAVKEGDDVWKKTQRKWLCSRWHRNVQRVDYESTPCLHLSVRHIKVHCSNGLFAKWASAEFISLSSLLCFKYLSLRQKWTLLSTLCLLQNRFHFHLHSLFCVCLCCPSLSSISASLGEKWRIEKYSSRSVTFYCHYPCSTFFTSSAADKSGRTYLSNRLVIFSSALHVMYVLRQQIALKWSSETHSSKYKVNRTRTGACACLGMRGF